MYYQNLFPLFWDCFKNIPAFYKELLKTWIICGGDKSPHNFREIRKQIIWGYQYIEYKGKCLIKVN
jgi:hypothetical protein